MKIYQLLAITFSLLFNQAFASEITIDFDGTEEQYLTKINTNPATEATNQTFTDSLGITKDTVYYAGNSNNSAVHFFSKTGEIDLYQGDLTLEGTFYNRSNDPRYNETGFIIVPFGSTNYAEGLAIGHNVGIFFANLKGALKINTTTGTFVSEISEKWHVVSITLGVVNNKLVVKELKVNGSTALSNVEIADASQLPWLKKAGFGFLVDDMVDNIKLTGPAIKATPSGLSSIPSTSLLTLMLLMTGILSVGYYRFKSK